MFSKPGNPLDLPQKSITGRVPFKVNSVDRITYSGTPTRSNKANGRRLLKTISEALFFLSSLFNTVKQSQK